MKTKPFGIYRHNSKWTFEDSDRAWELKKRYDTIDKAEDALRDLTKTPKSKRDDVYIILPMRKSSDVWIEVKEEMSEVFLTMGK